VLIEVTKMNNVDQVIRFFFTGMSHDFALKIVMSFGLIMGYRGWLHSVMETM
jgi:hypothetical protein